MTLARLLIAVLSVMATITAWGIVEFLVEWRKPNRQPPGW